MNDSPRRFEEKLQQERYSREDLQALGWLWTEHERLLRRHAMRFTRGDRDLAEEALGELGAKLARPAVMRMYRPQDSWATWTRRILQNIVRDMMRRKFRPPFQLTKTNRKQLVTDGVAGRVVNSLEMLEGRAYWDEARFESAVAEVLSSKDFRDFYDTIRERARSPFGSAQMLHENQESPRDGLGGPINEVARKEVGSALSQVLEELPEELRAIFLMHVSMGWSFIRIAFVLYGIHDANLVSRPFYKARNIIKAEMIRLGHDNSQAL